MDIVIAGAGEVGTHLANMLSKQEHNIMLIDSDEEKLELLGNQLDVMSIVGSCTSIGALKDAGVHKCDLFIAVNHQEDQNINSAILAKKLGAKQTIARVNNSEYLEDENKEYLKMIGIDSLIYPERLAAEEIVASPAPLSAKDAPAVLCSCPALPRQDRQSEYQGTDHAAIATEVKVIEALKKEGIDKEMPRC